MASSAAALLKRTAAISRTLHTSSRLYAPLASMTDLVPAAPYLSLHKPRTRNQAFSKTPLRDIFKLKNVGTSIDRWAAPKENGTTSVALFCKGPTPCVPQLASVVPTFCRRFITTMGNPVKSVSQDASALASDAPPHIKFKRLDKTARHIMQILDKEAVEQVKAQREIPDIRPGYIVQLKLEVPENKRRVSVIKGIVIARRNAGLNTTFRLRRLVAGVGVESLLPLYSPNIKEIKVLDKKKVRRAKLYYLRDKMNALKKH